MLKKIVLWTVFAGLAAVLVVGAVNRTSSKSTQTGEGHSASRGQGTDVRVSLQEDRSSDNQGDNQQNRSGKGGAQENSDPLERAQASSSDWVYISSNVVQVDEQTLTLEQREGVQLVIEGRAWRYALESGFVTDLDHDVLAAGFYEDGEFKAVVLDDLTTGESIVLRESSGQPMWSGQGRWTT
jgi:hypothetical protein